MSEVSKIQGDLQFLDSLTYITRDISGNLQFTDAITGTRTLADLISSTYTLPVSAAGVLGGVLSGTGISVDVSGNVTIVNDSHTHNTQYLGLNATSVNSQLLDNLDSSAFAQLAIANTFTEDLTLGEGKNLNLRPAAGVSDAGDIIFQTNTGTEAYRLYSDTDQVSDTLSFRKAGGTTYGLYHSGNLDVSNFAQLSAVNTFTNVNNIAAANATPLTVQRTNTDSNVSIGLSGSATLRYLGLKSAGVLAFGSSADLNSSGNDIYHEGNLTKAVIDALNVDADTVDGWEGDNLASLNFYYGSGLGDPNDATVPYMLSNHVNTPNSSYFWHIRTQFYTSISATGNRAQIALSYNSVDQAYIRKCYSNVWGAWQRIDNGDTTLVKTTGAQTIAGIKTFSDSPVLSNNKSYNIKTTGGVTIRTLLINTSNTVYMGGVDVGSADTIIRRGGSDKLRFYSTSARFVDKLELNDANTSIDEGASNSIRLGTDSGWMDIGPRNTSWCHFDTDRADNYFYESLTAPDFKLTSDIHFKKNIVPYNNGLLKVLALKPSYFDWDETKEREGRAREGRDLGMISQQVEEIEPMLVDTEADGYKSLKYNKIAVLNTAAIQEMYHGQKKVNKRLIKRIEELEKLLRSYGPRNYTIIN